MTVINTPKPLVQLGAGAVKAGPQRVDLSVIEDKLRDIVEGEVRFADGDRAMYASDAGNYRMPPLGVVLPKNVHDVMRTVEICRSSGIPIVARGGGTGIPGQTVNTAVLLDFSKYMNRILDMRPSEHWAVVEPGIVLDTLRNEANRHGLTFGPDPATHSRCTLGGMIGNNSCGIHSVMGGETVDNIEGLDVLTYDGVRMNVGPTSDEDLERIIRSGGRRGEIYGRLRALRDRYADHIRKEFPHIPRRVSGYNLPALLPENGFDVAKALVGSECTCVLVLGARTKLIPNPPVRSLVVIGYPDIFEAADHVVEPMKYLPIGLEALDHVFIDDMQKKGMHPPHLEMLPEGRAWLLIEFGGKDKQESDIGAKKLMEDYRKGANPPAMKLFDDPEYERLIWHLREEGLGATARVPGEPENHEGWEDASVPPAKLGPYLRDFKKLLDKHDYHGALYGHFGQGCVHTRLNFDLKTSDGIRKFRQFLGEAADLVVSYGGSLSGEHGDGQARGELLPRMYSPEIMQAFREFKSIWDPDWKMNPGKVINPYRVDENLRLGPGFNPPETSTHFQFPDDDHSFTHATERCVGAGVCRRHGGGTMCPSYMVTREEKHSTRGRARMLNEMIRGEVVHGGWKSEAVKDALDLCLSCKGCKADCPVQVDMATYKAEFLSHYYEGRLRPRHAYASGFIFWWARMASIAPSVANFFTQTPPFNSLAKSMAGYAHQRQIPKFAGETFKHWFFRRRPRNQEGQTVLLWADTFNNYFTPSVAQAAVEVLEAAGCHVEVSNENICCGRPLYDFGLLERARKTLENTLHVLKPAIEAGTPVVGLEPSCISVFRDELPNLLAGNEDAKRLSSQFVTLAQFMRTKAGYAPPHISGRAIVHGHCHHKSILKFDDEESMLKKTGLDCTILDSGCCGMAGAFGYEKEHYDLSVQCGERVLLPAVRAAATDDILVADGFSCREQILQQTGRRALHFAEVLRQGIL